jgi:phage terminase large subunit GpA-like protein
MSSQAGKTETMLNIVGHKLTDFPQPTLIVEPTEKLVRSISSDRFDAMVNATPILKQRLAKGQKNKVTEKFFGGVRLGFAWAGSATELASHPNAMVLIDEVDRMQPLNEGDVVSIASARTTTYWNRKICMFSSPTIEGASTIWKWFLRGTMLMWSWHCPNCSESFVPMLKTLKWAKDATPEQAHDTAHVECPYCKHKIYDEKRPELNRTGQYVPYTQDQRGNLIKASEIKKTSIASFFVGGLCSPFVTFNKSAEQIVRAYRSHDQNEIQAVINTRFGEPFVMDGQVTSVAKVEILVDSYEQCTVPDGVQFITCGIDVGKTGFYVTVRGWGHMSESWLIDYEHIYGDTDNTDVWQQLSNFIGRSYSGKKIRRVLIDCGYRPNDKWRLDQHLVKTFISKHAGQVSAVFGRQNLNGETIRRSEMTLDAGGQKVKTGIPQFLVDRDHFNQWMHSRYNVPLNQSGAFHLYAGTPEFYLKHLVSEMMIIKPSGVRVWVVRRGYENHFFDAEVYARVAAVVEGVESLPQKQVQKPKKQPQQQPYNEWSQGYI